MPIPGVRNGKNEYTMRVDKREVTSMNCFDPIPTNIVTRWRWRWSARTRRTASNWRRPSSCSSCTRISTTGAACSECTGTGELQIIFQLGLIVLLRSIRTLKKKKEKETEVTGERTGHWQIVHILSCIFRFTISVDPIISGALNGDPGEVEGGDAQLARHQEVHRANWEVRSTIRL